MAINAQSAPRAIFERLNIFFDRLDDRAAGDIAKGLLAAHIWGYLGLHDIRQRYRRSLLGPFWFTLTTLVLVSVIGVLYSALLKQDIKEYVPYLAVGLVIWQYIGTVVNEGATVFTTVDYLIKQVKLPLTTHVAREVWRNFVIMLHSLPVVVLLLLVVGRAPGWSILEAVPGLAALFATGVWIGIVVGILGTRFRDIPPTVNSLIQIAFFFTPVMWSPEHIGDRAWIAEFNPLYHLIEVVRAPVLGRAVSLESWLWVLGTLIVGFASAQWLMKRYRARVPYWL
jgi:ABC-type polysaccharide/polyol phosphate export permease